MTAATDSISVTLLFLHSRGQKLNTNFFSEGSKRGWRSEGLLHITGSFFWAALGSLFVANPLSANPFSKPLIFSQTFWHCRDIPAKGISRQKSLISLVSRDIPNLLAPTPSCGRPLPPQKTSGLKSLGLGPFFMPDFQKLEKAVAVSGVCAGVFGENSGKVPGKVLEKISRIAKCHKF